MESHIKENQSNVTTIIIVVGLLMIAYMIYSLTLSIYRNYNINLHIQNFQNTNEELQKEIENKIKNYEYFTSKEYQDKVAKQNLGKVNQGEEVIVIPPSAAISVFEFENDENIKEERLSQMSNLRKWWEFFFIENNLRY